MKKVLLGLVVIAAMGVFSSCKKECKCVGKIDGEEVITQTVETKEKCADASYTEDFMGTKIEVKCN